MRKLPEWYERGQSCLRQEKPVKTGEGGAMVPVSKNSEQDRSIWLCALCAPAVCDPYHAPILANHHISWYLGYLVFYWGSASWDLIKFWWPNHQAGCHLWPNRIKTRVPKMQIPTKRTRQRCMNVVLQTQCHKPPNWVYQWSCPFLAR